MQNLFRYLYRQTHNICKRTSPFGYDEIPALLNAIRSRFVERVNDLTLGVDYGVVEGLKSDFAADAFVDFQLPTLYEVRDGEPSLVNFQVQGGTYVVPKVLERGYLIVGKDRFSFQQGR